MKNIKTILEAFELTDEQKATIIKGVEENYKTVAEFDQKQTKLTDAEKDITRLNSEMDTLKKTVADSSGSEETIKALQKQIDDYAADEKTRLEKSKLEERNKRIADEFDKAVGENKFREDDLREYYLEKAISAHEADTLKSIGEIFKELTDGKDVFVTKQTDPAKLPIPGAKGDDEEKPQMKSFF